MKCEGEMAITWAGKVQTGKLYCEAELKRTMEKFACLRLKRV